MVLATAASLQDRDGGCLILAKSRARMTSLARVWADGGCAGSLIESARNLLGIALDIFKKPTAQHTCEVPPRRWVVERTPS